MKDFRCTITDPERAAEWEKHLGTKTVFIKSPIPVLASLPGHPCAEIYELDLDLLTDEQRESLIAWMAEKYSCPVDYVRQGLASQGVPILAEHCIVSIDNPQRWLS
jgi:hypothetical protein